MFRRIRFYVRMELFMFRETPTNCGERLLIALVSTITGLLIVVNLEHYKLPCPAGFDSLCEWTFYVSRDTNCGERLALVPTMMGLLIVVDLEHY